MFYAMCQVDQSPCKVSMLKTTFLWWKPDMSLLLCVPFLFLPFSLLSISSLLFLFLSFSSDGRMRCVQRRWANTLPMPDLYNLSHVTTGFSFATVAAAKVKRKDSRKLLVKSQGRVFFPLAHVNLIAWEDQCCTEWRKCLGERIQAAPFMQRWNQTSLGGHRALICWTCQASPEPTLTNNSKMLWDPNCSAEPPQSWKEELEDFKRQEIACFAGIAHSKLQKLVQLWKKHTNFEICQ